VIQALRARQAFKLGLKFADALKSIFAAIFMPSPLRAFERRLQPDLPFVQREGVAPASFHLSVPGPGFGEPVTSMRDRTIDEVEDRAVSMLDQMGSQPRAVKGIVDGYRGKEGIPQP
jgi:hypothetical protein